MFTRKLSIIICLFIAGFSLSANAIDRQALAKYAQSLKGLKKEALKEALESLMNKKKVLGYGSGSGKTWSGFYKTDRNPKTNECYNRYSSRKFYFSDGNTTNSISGMNIEHSFPKSWWGGAKNQAYKDLYNLYPSDSKANSSKSNYPMDEVINGEGEKDYDMVGTGRHTSKAWEPGDRFKGEFARSYMYMGVTYGAFTFSGTGSQTMNNEAYPGMKPWATTLYRAWSKLDKVDSIEVARNNAVNRIQKNRNLFIDYPYLAEYVWGDSIDKAFDPTTSITTASDDGRYMKSTTTEPDVPVVDDVYIFSKVDKVTSGKEYLIVAEDNGTMHVMKPLESSRKYGHPEVENTTATKGKITVNSKDNVFIITAEGSGYTIEDSQHRFLWHDGTYKTISVTDDDRDAGIFTFTASSDGSFKIAADDGYYMQYSTRYKSYGLYTDSQGLMPSLYEFDAKATGINIIKAMPAVDEDTIYNMQGISVGTKASNLQPGLYIRGGKKFIVR